MNNLVRGLAVLAFLAGGAGTAWADASGQAVGVNPQAEAEAKSGTRLLTVGTDVFIGDRVVTGAEGQVQIKFSDNTKLVVGPSSALLIEDYLIRNNGSAGKFAINALNGTFRFVTGNAPKDSYVINTPTGTIGVRGTVVELRVFGDLTHFMVTEGKAFGCPKGGGECVELENVCEYGTIAMTSAESFGHADEITGEQRDQIKEFFKYANNQMPLLRPFRVEDAERCLRRPAPTGGTPSSVAPGGESSDPMPPQEEPCDCITYRNTY